MDIQIWLSHFSNNSGAGEGGGIHAFFSYSCASLLWVLKNCTFHRNEAKEGAGIYASVSKLDEMKINITGIEFRQCCQLIWWWHVLRCERYSRVDKHINVRLLFYR